MPYAIDGKVSTSPIEGGIEITDEQYSEAIAGMLSGDVVTVEGGFAVGPKPEPVPDPVEPPTFDEVKSQKIDALSSEYQSRVRSFPWHFGAEYGVLHLQLRDVTDQANWLTLLGKAQMLIAAGQGGAEVLAIRTEENITVPVTANVAAQVMDALSSFGGATLAHKWALKDAINAAEDHAALDAIDITVGWPG